MHRCRAVAAHACAHGCSGTRPKRLRSRIHAREAPLSVCLCLCLCLDYTHVWSETNLLSNQTSTRAFSTTPQQHPRQQHIQKKLCHPSVAFRRRLRIFRRHQCLLSSPVLSPCLPETKQQPITAWKEPTRSPKQISRQLANPPSEDNKSRGATNTARAVK